MDLLISKKNEVYLKVEAEPHLNYELADFFTFEVESAKFMQKNRRFKGWDGKIRLYSPATGEIYCGLVDYLTQWAEEKGYQYSIEDHENFGHPQETNSFVTPRSVVSFVKSLHLPQSLKVRDYQYKAIYEALKYNRRLLLSPTASGKSLMIYALIRYHINVDRNVLIVVPTTSLVEQMYKDFESYGWKTNDCHKIYAGADKYTDHSVVITTWQSIYKEPRKWFDRFDVVIGDEAHQFKSASLVKIMTKLHEAKYRYGFTGTLDGTQTHKLVLEGLFGPSYKTVKTHELMEKGYLAKLNAKIILLKHPMSGKVCFDTYEEEIQYLISHEKRNNFIKNLALDLKGNTLILYSRVETHGQIIYDLINSSDDRKVFFIHGGVDVEDREQVREITEKETNAIIVASYGTFSTGINIKNLHNVIFASPSKSRIRNLQSIGRVLRKGSNKFKATLYDIADDCTVTLPNLETKRNYTLNHLVERIKIYNEEHFNYDLVRVSLKEKK